MKYTQTTRPFLQLCTTRCHQINRSMRQWTQNARCQWLPQSLAANVWGAVMQIISPLLQGIRGLHGGQCRWGVRVGWGRGSRVSIRGLVLSRSATLTRVTWSLRSLRLLSALGDHHHLKTAPQWQGSVPLERACNEDRSLLLTTSERASSCFLHSITVVAQRSCNGQTINLQ